MFFFSLTIRIHTNMSGARPCPQYLGVPLYQSVTLRLRRALAVFIRLAQPPADHHIATILPEAVD